MLMKQCTSTIVLLRNVLLAVHVVEVVWVTLLVNQYLFYAE